MTHFNGILYYTKTLNLRDTVSPKMLWACYSKNNLLKTKTLKKNILFEFQITFGFERLAKWLKAEAPVKEMS